jgi:hypothetical protein
VARPGPTDCQSLLSGWVSSRSQFAPPAGVSCRQVAADRWAFTGETSFVLVVVALAGGLLVFNDYEVPGGVLIGAKVRSATARELAQARET